jgi:hypothetical protein
MKRKPLHITALYTLCTPWKTCTLMYTHKAHHTVDHSSTTCLLFFCLVYFLYQSYTSVPHDALKMCVMLVLITVSLLHESQRYTCTAALLLQLLLIVCTHVCVLCNRCSVVSYTHCCLFFIGFVDCDTLSH